MKPPRERRAIGLGLLLPALLLTHPSAADADSRTSPSPTRKTTSTTEASVDRKARSLVDAGPSRRTFGRAGGQTVHVVRAGDSVSRIAAHYGVTRKSLIDANKLARPEQLRIGQRLVVPGAPGAPGGDPVQLIDATLENGDILFVRAGPRRVSTRFYMASPGFDGRALDLAWPVDGRIISPFGKRRGGWHAGMDIKAEMGTPILAAAPGVVISSGQERAYGRIIRIEHDNGFVTVYAHNLENLVEVGDRVTGGTIIATVGRTGRTSTPHLHFEVRHEGMVYNPLHLLPAREAIEIRPDEAPDLPTESARAQVVDDDVDE
ncbi:MAG TPA: M23 family metallopeptidase [Methylomirabilota bacterium]|nr:M23 family metallopeptidase [Methylomirabilota bacterium]